MPRGFSTSPCRTRWTMVVSAEAASAVMGRTAYRPRAACPAGRSGRSRHVVSLTAIALILVAALAHASWNLFSKQASTTGAVFFIWLVAAWATALYVPVVLIAVLVSRPHVSG